MKVFLDYNGVEYHNYDMLAVNYRYPPNVLVDVHTYSKLRTMTGPWFSSAKPAHGSSVKVVQPCTVGIGDIRKNYTIKRKREDADYIVYSPIPDAGCTFMYRYVIIPKHNLIVADFSNPSLTNSTSLFGLFKIAAETIGDPYLSYDYDVIAVDTGQATRMYLVDSEDFFDLISGNLPKPAIPYTNLDYSTGNELTVDCLRLVYLTGNKTLDDASNFENFQLQLKALNQTNWREYPGTMRLLFTWMLNHTSPLYYNMKKYQSGYDKTVKLFLNIANEDYASKKDWEMSRSFLQELLKINGTIITEFSNLERKLSEFGLGIEEFNMFFDSKLRIAPKEYNVQD